MGPPTRERWCMQLRLGLEGEVEIPEVWAALGEESRARVVERLAQVMVNALATGSGQGGEQAGEANENEGGEGSGEDGDSVVTITRIA